MERAVVREVRGLRGTGSRYGEEERGGGDRRLCRGRNSLNRRRRRRWYREAWRVGVPPGGARGDCEIRLGWFVRVGWGLHG